LPFKTLAPEDAGFVPYHNCVPLVGLQVAAGAWSQEQGGLTALAEHAENWVALDDGKLEPGMFVAQVVGRSMEPLVPGQTC
jgi:hypothetical protein